MSKWKRMDREEPSEYSKIVVYNYEYGWFEGGVVSDGCIWLGEGDDYPLDNYDIWRYIDIPDRSELYDE